MSNGTIENLEFTKRTVYTYEVEAFNEKHVLSSDEFYFYTKKGLDISDIVYYKKLVGRDLSDKELKIIVLLSANGLRLDDIDFRKHF